MQIAFANPKKSRSKSKKTMATKVVRKKGATRRRIGRSISAGYSKLNASSIMATVKDGAIGALGAVGVEAITKRIPLPASMSTGYGAILVNVAVGVGLGYVVSKFAKKPKLGHALAGGAVTVALFKTVRDTVGGPLGLDGWDDSLMGNESLMDGGLLGFYSPGPNFSTPSTMNGVGVYENNEFL